MKIYYFAASFHFDIKRKDFLLNVSVKFIPYLLIQKKKKGFFVERQHKTYPLFNDSKEEKKREIFC
jgi:hypothetical protein